MSRFANARLRLRGALVLLAVVPYLQTLFFGFTLDDSNTILGHPGVQGALSWTGIVLHDAWGRSRFDTIGIWRPLATLTFWCARHLAAGRPWPFHLQNVALFAAFIALADRFLGRWCPALSDGARGIALALFASLAIHACVVPYPTGAADLLAALFSLGAIAAVTRTAPLGARDITIGVAGLACALASKESSAPMAILLPILALRADRRSGAPSRAPVVALALWCALVLGAVVAFRASMMPFMSLGPERAMENPLLALDPLHRLLGAIDVLGLYLRHMATGARLSPDYSFSEPPILRDGTVGLALGGLFVAAAVAALIAGWGKMPRLADAVLAFGASYVATSNVALGASAIADRFFFFPSFWVIVAVAMLVDRAVRRPQTRRMVCAVAIMSAVLQERAAIAYASSWRDDLTLLTRSVRLYPNVFRAQRNLAHALTDVGNDEAASYHLVAAEILYARYPAPVSRDAIVSAWEEEPFGARLEHLRATFGATPTCAAAKIASMRIRSWGRPAAADGIEQWLNGSCSSE